MQCHKQLRLITGCVLSLHLLALMMKGCRGVSYPSLLLSYCVYMSFCDMPEVPGSRCPLPDLSPPLASYTIIMRPEKIVFHLANLIEKLGRKRGRGRGQLPAESADSTDLLCSPRQLKLMHDSLILPVWFFGLTRFLHCLYPSAGTAMPVQRQRCNYVGRNVREGTYRLTGTKAVRCAAETRHQRQSQKALLR